MAKAARLNLPYFRGSTSDVWPGAEGAPTPCAFCKKKHAVQLDPAEAPEAFLLPRSYSSGSVCLPCLRKGKFEISHETEQGLLGRGALRGMSKHACKELRRTPRILMWQGERWLVHCDDFMTFLGVWHAAELKRERRKDPAGLFDEMCPDWAGNYEEWFGKDAHAEETLYAFRCRECGVLRGHIDNP